MNKSSFLTSLIAYNIFIHHSLVQSQKFICVFICLTKKRGSYENNYTELLSHNNSKFLGRPLHDAINQKNVRLIRKLIKEGANVEDKTYQDEQTPLELALSQPEPRDGQDWFQHFGTLFKE